MSKPNHDSLLRWLSPLRSSQRHRDLRLNRIADVSCSWLDNPEFLRWRDADNSEEVLFCSGKSGSGLTTLTSIVIDHLYDVFNIYYPRDDNGRRVGLLCLYCDYLEEHIQTPVNGLGDFLRQIEERELGLVKKNLRSQKRDITRGPLVSEWAVELLTATLNIYDTMYICLDGMDTWEEAKVRDILQSLYEVLQTYRGRWKLLFMASAPYSRTSCPRIVTECLAANLISIEFHVQEEDRLKCLEYWIEKDHCPEQTPEVLRNEIIQFLDSFYCNKGLSFLDRDIALRYIFSQPSRFTRRRSLLFVHDTLRKPDGVFKGAVMTRIQELPSATQAMTMLRRVRRQGIVTIKEIRGQFEQAGIAPEYEDDSFGEYLRDISLGIVTIGKASRTVRLASHALWKYIQHYEFPADTSPQRTKDCSVRRTSSKERESYRITGYTTNHKYDRNGESDIDVDIDVDYDHDYDYDDDHNDDHCYDVDTNVDRHNLPKESSTNQDPNNCDNKGDVHDHRKASGNVDTEDDKELQNSLLSSIITESPNVQWHGVAGLETAKEALQEAIILPLRFPSLYSPGRRRPWSTILLYGPPGTGKTLLAKAAATETQRTFFSISAGDLLSKWHGQSERLIRQLFVLARRRKPSVIFIDEIDSLGTSRADVEHAQWHLGVQTELFVQLDGVGSSNNDVLLMAATNVPWHLDSSLRRRFHRRIYIPLPGAEARIEIFKQNLASTGSTFDDLPMLASLSESFSGSDISIAVQEVLMQPVRKILKSKYFKRVDGEKLMPAAATDEDAIEMTYHDVPDDKVVEPPLQMLDFITALRVVRPSLDPGEIKKFEDWTHQFGITG